MGSNGAQVGVFLFFFIVVYGTPSLRVRESRPSRPLCPTEKRDPGPVYTWIRSGGGPTPRNSTTVLPLTSADPIFSLKSKTRPPST